MMLVGCVMSHNDECGPTYYLSCLATPRECFSLSIYLLYDVSVWLATRCGALCVSWLCFFGTSQ
jgi:hypothetical protein